MMKKLLLTIMVVASLTAVFGVMNVFAVPNPTIHLKFDGDLKDSSGNGYDAVIDDGIISYDEKGVFGKCAKISSSKISIPNSAAIKPSQFTLSAWMKLETEIPGGTILYWPTKNSSSTAIVGWWWSYGNTANTISLNTKSIDSEDSGQVQDVYSEYNLESTQTVEKFVHVAVVYTGKETKIFVDGKLNSSTKINENSSGELFGEFGDIILGYDQSEFFNGWMDDFRLYNTALTTQEVVDLYNSQLKAFPNTIVLQLENPVMVSDNMNKEIDPGRGTVPTTIKDRTVMPISNLIIEMGGKVSWNGKEQLVTITYKDKTVKLWINKYIADVNGVSKNLEVAPVVLNGRTMMPLSFIIDNLGLKIEWNGQLRKITIRYAK